MLFSSGFHEATIVSLAKAGTTIRIGLEGVQRIVGLAELIVELLGVREVYVNGVATELLQMESDDGEVLDLERVKDGIELLVLWNDFSLRRTTTMAYRFVCESVRIEATSSERER